LCKKGKRVIDKSVKETLEKEEKEGLDRVDVYEKFADTAEKKINEIYTLVDNLHKQGKTVYVYGASTRGNALLQACNLDSTLIQAAADRNPMKWNKVMVGSWIPIVSEATARLAQPDYFLVLPWQFRDEFIKREEDYLNGGGKFIFLFPEIEIYGQ